MARSSHKRLTTQAVQVDLQDLKANRWSLRLPGGYAQTLGEQVVIDWQGRRFTLPLTETAPHYGGQRFWFCCPRCGGRARILYSPDFYCRRCSGLLHPSTRQTTRDRAVARAVGIRRGLGASGSLLEPFPIKPKGMRRRAWLKLFSRCEQYERKSLVGLATAIENLSARLSRTK